MEYKKYLYAAYGSNLNLGQMKRRCPTAELIGTTIIPNSTLLFKNSCRNRHLNLGVLDIIQCKGSETPVALFRITQEDENSLDIYEGFPNMYVKKTKFVELDGVKHKIMFYAMNKETQFFPSLPSVQYYNTVVQGYADNKFDVSNICKCFSVTAKLVQASFLRGENSAENL